MAPAPQADTGLKLGLIVLAVTALGFVALFLFGPSGLTKLDGPQPQADTRIADVLVDMGTREAIEALKAVSPATYAELDALATRTMADGGDAQAVSELVLAAMFAQFKTQAGSVKAARSADYQTIVAELAAGLQDLKATESSWCDGARIAAFLSQNEADLVPSLLAEFPYGSAQYDWAMGWMTTVLRVARQGQMQPQSHARPGFRDEAILQQQGLALGSEQWALGLQIAAFANSEGTSYGEMKRVVSSMNVCDLGIAVETVSGRLPPDVRGRIWSDLMPEIMVGNTPYVMYRVTDYFFIG